jgi:nitrogen fixation-related uncharacterized protein
LLHSWVLIGISIAATVLSGIAWLWPQRSLSQIET